jgi:U3 small nucleolar RNA-associated protein 21
MLIKLLSQMRNKPKQPPKAPKAAPFFLPTVAGVVPQFDTSVAEEEKQATVCFFAMK